MNRGTLAVIASSWCIVVIVLTSGTVFGQDAEPAKQELDNLQGTWKFAFYEEKGVEQRPGTRQFVISDNKLTYRSNGQDKVATTIEVDLTQNPKHLTQKFPNGLVSNIIYVLADDYIILCGHRDKTKRPTEFSCGTDKGGEFLIVLKRE